MAERTDVAASGVEGAEVVFRLADPDHELASVRLWQELGLAGSAVDFDAVPGGWELHVPRPTVRRMEYLFEVREQDGTERSDVDPTNPLRVDGAFGAHSVLELPGYQPPDWLAADPVVSTVEELHVRSTPIGDVEVSVWAPTDTPRTQQLPLLLVHDGPELAAYASLTQYVGAAVTGRTVPRMRVALLGPGERNRRYAADLDYAATLVHRVLPAVRKAYPSHDDVALMGVSLGGLAALHAEWAHPGTFAGLFCQSGSFFTPETDPQEEDFVGFAAVTAFVARVLSATVAPSTPTVVLTCGSTEENVHNNRVMAAALSALGVDATLAENPDLHNFTAWRDAWQPHLTGFLQRVWRHEERHGGA